MSFNNLDVDGEKIPEGSSVKVIRSRDYRSWWEQDATLQTYALAALIIAVAALAAILWVG